MDRVRIVDLHAEIRNRVDPYIRALLASSVPAYHLGYVAADLGGLRQLVEGLEYRGDLVEAKKPHRLDGLTIVYNNPTQGSQTYNNQAKFDTVQSWQLVKSVASVTGANITLSLPFKLGTFGLSASQTLTTTSQSTRQDSTSQSFGWSVVIPLPPRSRVETQVLVEEASYRIPFAGLVRILGDVIANIRFNFVIPGTGREIRDVTNSVTVPVGMLFRGLPHEDVTVMGDSEISCPIEGIFEGFQGTNLRITTSTFPLEGTGEPEINVLFGSSLGR